MVNNAQKQTDSYKESLSHISSSWNSVATSMTKYMGEIDRRNLNLSQPQSRSVNTYKSSPSLDSYGAPDHITGISVKLTPGYSYKSNFGCFNYFDNENFSFTASTAEGSELATLVSSINSIKPLETIMNKDLMLIIQRMKRLNKEFKLYAQQSKEAKFNL